MRWVAISVSIAADPAVHRIAAALRVRVPEVVGFLTLTFAGIAQHAADGRVADVPDTLLEAWSGWHGKKGAFASQFRAELCDDDGVVTAWDRWNGANIRKAERAIERTRQWRTEREQKANVTHNGTHSTTHNVGDSVRHGTGQDRTEPRTLTATKGSASAPPRVPRASEPAWVDRVRERWTKRVGKTTAKALVSEIGQAIAEHGEPVVLEAIELYADGRNGRPQSLKFFAAEIVQWIAKAKDDTPIVADGWLTAAGERATR
jgi:hypothetical protein